MSNVPGVQFRTYHVSYVNAVVLCLLEQGVPDQYFLLFLRLDFFYHLDFSHIL